MTPDPASSESPESQGPAKPSHWHKALESESAQDRPRGAIKFREIWTDSHLQSADPYFTSVRPRADLPRHRSFFDLPYLRPFSRRKSRRQQKAAWELEGGSRGAAAGRLRAALWVTAATVSLLLAQRLVSLTRQTYVGGVAPPLSAIESAGQMAFEAQPEIEGVLRRFLDAASPEEKAIFLRGGDAILPRLREYYARHQPEQPLETVLLDTLNWIQRDGKIVVYGLFETKDGLQHQFAAELNGGRLLLDWQTLTGWTGADWTAFLDAQPAGESVMCVSAVPDTLYAGPFASAANWVCLRLEDVSRQRAAWGYVRRGTPVSAALPAALLNEKDSTPRRLTVRLRFADSPGAAAAALLEITAIEYEGWFDASLTTASPSVR